MSYSKALLLVAAADYAKKNWGNKFFILGVIHKGRTNAYLYETKVANCSDKKRMNLMSQICFSNVSHHPDIISKNSLEMTILIRSLFQELCGIITLC